MLIDKIETYLQTEQARQDVSDLMAGVFPTHEAIWTPEPNYDIYMDWEKGSTHAWTCVSLDGWCVYYRPEGDRFIVSDLGEGLVRYRLMSGQCETMPRDLTQRRDGERNYGWTFCVCGLANVQPDNLPDAICRVLLASYRVANLGAGKQES